MRGDRLDELDDVADTFGGGNQTVDGRLGVRGLADGVAGDQGRAADLAADGVDRRHQFLGGVIDAVDVAGGMTVDRHDAFRLARGFLGRMHQAVDDAAQIAGGRRNGIDGGADFRLQAVGQGLELGLAARHQVSHVQILQLSNRIGLAGQHGRGDRGDDFEDRSVAAYIVGGARPAAVAAQRRFGVARRFGGAAAFRLSRGKQRRNVLAEILFLARRAHAFQEGGVAEDNAFAAGRGTIDEDRRRQGVHGRKHDICLGVRL